MLFYHQLVQQHVLQRRLYIDKMMMGDKCAVIGDHLGDQRAQDPDSLCRVQGIQRLQGEGRAAGGASAEGEEGSSLPLEQRMISKEPVGTTSLARQAILIEAASSVGRDFLIDPL